MGDLLSLGDGTRGARWIGDRKVHPGHLEHHKGLGLSDDDRQRIGAELEGGKAAVGVLAAADEAEAIAAKLAELGGTPEVHEVSDEVLEEAATVAETPAETPAEAPAEPAPETPAPAS